jgi:mono/diheme cytochrome c family protein
MAGQRSGALARSARPATRVLARVRPTGHDPRVIARRPLLLPAVLAVAVVATVATACGGPGGSSKPSASGATLYANNCARCHGTDGTGGAGPSLVNIAATFPDIDNQITFVSNGGGGMPRFGDLLSDADIREVVTYTRDTFR